MSEEPIEEYLASLLEQVLKLMVENDASDVYIKAKSPPNLRIEGQLVPVDIDPLTPEQTEILALQMMPPRIRNDFLEKKPEANLVYEKEGVGRFRVNIYKERGWHGIVMRRVKEDIPTVDDLGLPQVLKRLVMEKRGLVLVTGPTGSGKSTTLAAMIHHRNLNSTGHILTVEDPIEFVHKDIKCIVSQREVGSDTFSFQDAMENAVRQAPDVMLVGEMRDAMSVKTAVYFAETGHLVLSTLHSNNATQTVERVLQFFPSEMHEQILKQLSLNLKGIVSQRLIPGVTGARVAALEILINNARISDLIAKGSLKQMKKELDIFHPEGMQSFDHSLMELYKTQQITVQECIKNSDNSHDMKLKIKTMPVYIRSSGEEDERYR
ncbi:MAG: PilT/PilU family type 4a pilus ATPase [Candidatus Eremiobacteraeota bacterium]|nr:PilT/PilU family type 4a pilus ATPase [Candidatus Eremiobacteraeota bacterium]